MALSLDASLKKEPEKRSYTLESFFHPVKNNNLNFPNQGGDPTMNIQIIALCLGLNFRKYDTTPYITSMRKSGTDFMRKNYFFLELAAFRIQREDEDVDLYHQFFVRLEFPGLSTDLLKVPNKILKDFPKYLRGEDLHSKNSQLVNWNAINSPFILDHFGQFSPYINLEVEYSKWSAHRDNEEILRLHIGQPKPNIYTLDGLCWSWSPKRANQMTEFRKKNFADIEEAHAGNDYRPFGTDYSIYVTRMLELFTDTPKAKYAANSLSKASEQNNYDTVDGIINTSIDLLFSGAEKDAILRDVKKARLHMKRDWQSIPHLNLGPIELPKVGNGSGEYIMRAAPLLIELFSRAGIMTYQEAERMISQRIVHYIMQSTAFQLDYNTAVSQMATLGAQLSQASLSLPSAVPKAMAK